MKQQFIYINGGVPKENYLDYYDMLQQQEYNPYEEKFLSWNKTLGEYLGDDWEYLRAPLHDRDFADYQAWKIMFEKMIPFFEEDIYIGACSLGGSFILKYLCEEDGIFSEKFGKHIRIKKLFFLAAALRDTSQEVLGTFLPDLSQVHKVQRWTDQVYIYHSFDDDIVPMEQSIELSTHFPEAIFRQFHGKGHFYLEERIPELEEDIKSENSL